MAVYWVHSSWSKQDSVIAKPNGAFPSAPALIGVAHRLGLAVAQKRARPHVGEVVRRGQSIPAAAVAVQVVELDPAVPLRAHDAMVLENAATNCARWPRGSRTNSPGQFGS